MKNTNTMNTQAQANSVLAQVLSLHATSYKNKRINPTTLGDATLASKWSNTVKALKMTAYKVWVDRHDNVGNSDWTPISQNCVYANVKELVEMIGEVNGMKLNMSTIAEMAIGMSFRAESIDITEEMAHARCEKKKAKAKLDEEDTEENQANYDKWVDEVKRLESTSGNCKNRFTANRDNDFIKKFELTIGDAIAEQNARPAEEIEAEKAAKEAERKAKAKARKAAAKAKAKAEKATA